MTEISEYSNLLNINFRFKNIKIKNKCFTKNWKKVIDIWDDELKNKISEHIPELVNDGINNAREGVIQDPAGSAIGAPFLCGGGASGAIYSSFKLENIPYIEERSSIFNGTSDSNGMRVLHTHSPRLSGDPDNVEDCMNVVRILANTYINTIVSFLLRKNKLEDHGKVLNLVPISASVFGGTFRRDDLDHLDPSFTIVAIALAIGVLVFNKIEIPTLRLYFYDEDVFKRAVKYLQ